MVSRLSTVFSILLLHALISDNITATNAGGYNYSHRMRDCEITVINNGRAVSGAPIEVKQLRNHFGFGGTLRRWGFDTLPGVYGERFLQYFDIATPENEMKWEYVHKGNERNDPANYERADFMFDWCLEHDILVRGHNLFWNEKEDWLPEWARSLPTSDFKVAMKERIDDAMGHFKGKVIQWDIINEICHGINGSFPNPTMLEEKSGDPNIFSWILDESRKIDPDPEFVINDYNLITGNAADNFINKVSPLGNKFDIIGAEGHFGNQMDKNAYEGMINYLSQQLNKPVWLTEVDFTLTISQAPDKVEELMRTCFANPNVEGLIMWVWLKRIMWRENISSYFADSLGNETESGRRWRSVREEWKTNKSGTTNESGKFGFNGYQGKYQVTINDEIDTFYLEPGSETKAVEMDITATAAHASRLTGLKSVSLRLNGNVIRLTVRADLKRLFLTTFSLSGEKLSGRPLSIGRGDDGISVSTASGCHMYRIGTGRQTLHTGKIMRIN